MKTQKGYTLIEILVVVILFAMVSVIASQTIIVSLKGTKKSESISKVRQDVDYATGVIERQLRSAKSITSCTSTQINYKDLNDNVGSFSCLNVGGENSSIASGSANLTTSNLALTGCSFVCHPAVGSAPPYVSIDISAQDINKISSPISVETQITLRSY